MTGQFDNSTLRQKVQLRQRMLREVATPVVMETHGGTGGIWRRCYADVEQGVVFEKDATKAGRLARQRPHWAVYEANCERALGVNVGAHLCVNVLDVDPYGDPWPALEAFFTSERPRANPLIVVVNDGLRQKVRYGGAWSATSLDVMTQRYGNDLYPIYLDVCQELLRDKAAMVGYDLDRFTGYYCGTMKNMTHYAAVLRRG